MGPETGLDDVKKGKILPLEADHTILSSAQVKNDGATYPLPHHMS
jgi:hypothetical protein